MDGLWFDCVGLKQARKYAVNLYVLREQLVNPENTHRWGNDHCTAGFQFNKTGLDQGRENFFCRYVVKQLNPNL